jgi:hypothetical protein
LTSQGHAFSEETQVEFEIVQPRDSRVDVIFNKIFRLIAVVFSELLCAWSVVASHDDRVVFDSHIFIKAEEEVFREVVRVPIAEGVVQSHAELMNTRLSQEGHGHLGVPDVEVHRPATDDKSALPKFPGDHVSGILRIEEAMANDCRD